MRIFSKPFFTNYIVHPLSKDLTRGERAKALISSIAIGILTLGVCQAVCAVKFHNRRNLHEVKVTVLCDSEFEKIEAKRFLDRICPRNSFIKCEFLTKEDFYKDPTPFKPTNPTLFVYTPHMQSTEFGLKKIEDNQHFIVLFKCTERTAPPLGSFEKLNVAYLDSEKSPFKEFFTPIAEEATNQNGEE